MIKLPHSMPTHEEFKDDYYRKASTSYWLDRIQACQSAYNTETDDELKGNHLIEVYSVYLQLIEIFFINFAAYVAKPPSFLANLFMSNGNILDLANEFLDDREAGLKSYLKTHQRPILEMSSTDDSEAKLNADHMLAVYQSLLKEVIRDYNQDREMLNAYKHGFRVDFTSGENVLAIGIQGGQEMSTVLRSDAEIHYYSKKKENRGEHAGRIVVYDHIVTFSALRIFGKATFVYTLYENIVSRGKQDADSAPQTYRWFDVDPSNHLWNDSFGTFRSKFSIGYLK
jgi:hypothetical protein